MKEKIKNEMENFNRERSNKEGIILLKYRNKLRDCENVQKNELKKIENNNNEEIIFQTKKEFKPKIKEEQKENYNK